MKLRLLFIFCLGLSSLLGWGQNDTAYVSVFGTAGNEELVEIKKNQSGNFYGIGNTSNQSIGEQDIFFIVLDSNLNQINFKIIGTEFIESAIDFEVLKEDTIIISGITNAWGKGGYEAYLLGIDTSGTILFEETFGLKSWDRTIGIEIINNELFLGYESDSLGIQILKVLKLSAEGVLKQSSSYYFNHPFHFNDMTTDKNGNLYFSGRIDSIGTLETDPLIFSINDNLKERWTIAPKLLNDQSLNKIKTYDSLVVSVGFTYHLNNGNKDYLLTEIDTSGNFKFNAVPNFYPNDDDELFDIQLINGRFALLGSTKSIGASPGINDFQFIESNLSGNLIDGYNYGWQNRETPLNFISNNTGYLLFGNTNSIGFGYGDFLCIEINSNYSKGPYKIERKKLAENPDLINSVNQLPKQINSIQKEIQLYSLDGKLIFKGYRNKLNEASLPIGIYIEVTYQNSIPQVKKKFIDGGF